jgi:hypothetical protein
MYHYDTAKKLLAAIISDFRILSGDDVGPEGMSWQGVALDTSCHLRVLADMIDEARRGEVRDGPIVFPSPDDFVRVVMEKDDCYACAVGDTHTAHHPESREEHKETK